MKNQSYRKGWGFVLTLVLVFTTMFGGFGFLGINGIVDEVYADPASTPYYSGAPAGTIGAPTTYLINTEEQLRDLATAVSSGSGIKYENTTFELMNNINLTSDCVPIGANAKPFSGIFDGKNFEITGIQIGTPGTPESTYSYTGLFGYTSGSAIKNLGVNVQINSSKESAYVGGLVGRSMYGTITNCYATGGVNGGSAAYVGGLVGWNNYGKITACYSTSNVTGANGSTSGSCTDVGGLVGWSNYGIIKNCYATGGVTGGDLTYVGGLVGMSSDSDEIKNCYAMGDVTAGSEMTLVNGGKGASLAGGLVGLNSSATIENCYATGGVTGGVGAKIGGLAGYNQGNGSINISKGYWNRDAIQMLSGAAVVNKLDVGQIFNSTVSTTSMTSIAMTDSGFVTTLNNWVNGHGITYYKWVVDSGSINGGYPLLDLPTYTMTASSLTAFGSQTVGYSTAPTVQTVTITNTGNQTITLTEPSTINASSNYIIGTLSSITLATGSSVTFTVQPKTGLAVGTYNETINITGTNGAAASVSAQFSVTSAGGGGSTSGSGGGSTPATPVINTNTGSVTGNQLKNAADAAKDGGTVTVKSDKTSEVTLLNSGLDSLSGKNNSLTVVTENGTLTFDSKAVGAIGTQATATDIKVIVDDVVKTTLSEEQQTKVGDKTVYDLSVMSGGKLISSFNGGKVKVSIPYELKTGEIAENLTVWYMADNGSLTEINCTYDAKNKAVTFVVDHFSKYIIGYDELAGWVNPFADVKSSAWYYDAVAFVNGNGFMNGQTDTAFGPQTSMTRGMFVTILGRMEGIDTALYASENTFSDVKSNQYYAPCIAWATDKGIVSGMGGDKFAPNAAVTREQMAVMMMNYMKLKGQGPTGEWAIQLTYSDLDQVSSWADEAVMFMTMKDLMNGMGNDAKGNPLFAPKATSTRAQTAQVMMSLGELVK